MGFNNQCLNVSWEVNEFGRQVFSEMYSSIERTVLTRMINRLMVASCRKKDKKDWRLDSVVFTGVSPCYLR